MQRMQIASHDVGDVTVLSLKGRMIYEEGDAPFKTRVDDLVAHGRLKLVVDLHDVTYMDSAGLGMLVAKCVSMHQRGGHFKILHPSARCQELMRITHLDEVFETFDTEEQAVRSFTS